MLELVNLVKDLAGEIIIVILFLYYLRARDRTYDSRLAQMTDLFTNTAKEGHEVAGKLGETLSDLKVEIARGKNPPT